MACLLHKGGQHPVARLADKPDGEVLARGLLRERLAGGPEVFEGGHRVLFMMVTIRDHQGLEDVFHQVLCGGAARCARTLGQLSLGSRS